MQCQPVDTLLPVRLRWHCLHLGALVCSTAPVYLKASSILSRLFCGCQQCCFMLLRTTAARYTVLRPARRAAAAGSTPGDKGRCRQVCPGLQSVQLVQHTGWSGLRLLPEMYETMAAITWQKVRQTLCQGCAGELLVCIRQLGQKVSNRHGKSPGHTPNYNCRLGLERAAGCS